MYIYIYICIYGIVIHRNFSLTPFSVPPFFVLPRLRSPRGPAGGRGVESVKASSGLGNCAGSAAYYMDGRRLNGCLAQRVPVGHF